MSTDTPKTDAPQRSRSESTQVIIAVVALIAVIWFAFANRHRVNISWWFFDRQSRLIYVIIVSAILGALADRFLLARLKRRN